MKNLQSYILNSERFSSLSSLCIPQMSEFRTAITNASVTMIIGYWSDVDFIIVKSARALSLSPTMANSSFIVICGWSNRCNGSLLAKMSCIFLSDQGNRGRGGRKLKKVLLADILLKYAVRTCNWHGFVFCRKKGSPPLR